MLDGSSIKLTSLRINHVFHQAGMKTSVSFSIDFVVRDPASDYIIRAHVSLSGHPKIELGDLLSMQAYRVPMAQSIEKMVIHVHEVA